MPPSTSAPNFSFQAQEPNPTVVARQKRIATEVQTLAQTLGDNCPPSEELTAAYNSLRVVQMWANQAILQPTGQTDAARG